MANFKMVQEFSGKAYFLPLPEYGYEVVINGSQLIDETSKLGKALLKYYGENVQYEGETKSLMEKIASGDIGGSGASLTTEQTEALTAAYNSKDAIEKINGLEVSASEIDNNIGLNLDFNTFEDNQEIPMLLWGGLIGATALPRVLNGTMTFAPANAGAGYSQYLHNAPVKRLYAKFRFGEYTTNTGSVDLITWANDFEQSYPIIPDSPCHLAVSPTSWNYSVCSGGTLTTVASGSFYTPLDIAKDYECEVVIDHDKQVATLCLPDGSVIYVSHANIGIKTNYSVFELYRNNSTDTIGAFTSIKSSVFGDDRLLDLYRSTLKQDKIKALTYAPTTAEYQVVPTSATLINAALVLPIIVPQSGSILVELTANVLHAAASNLLWQLVDSLAGSLRTISVSSTVYTGNIHASVVISGLTPGRTLNLQWKHFTTVANSATIQMHHASGFLTTMKATPL